MGYGQVEYEDQKRSREQPLGDLLKRLSQQVSTLTRQEIQLAKAELAIKGKELGRVAGS